MTSIQSPLANIPATTSVTSATSAATATAVSSSKNSAADTEHRFLTLMVAQLKNQDPLNPMDNSQITTQLAQIQTVNGVEQLNATMKSMAGGFDGLQAVQAASLAGRDVMTDGSTLTLANGRASGGFQLDQPVDRLSVSIVDAAGVLMQRVDLGPQAQGINAFLWDGMTDAGVAAPPGNYTFKLQAFAQNKEVTTQTLAIGSVNGVSRTADGVVLSVDGVGKVNMADIKQIM